MLSLYRSFRACWAAHFAAILALLGGGQVLAADGYFIPEVNLDAEHHSNIDLAEDTNEDSSVQGYTALASGILGFRTPRNVTELRPRIQFSDYPDRDEFRRTNYYLDLGSRYRSLRSDWNLVGSYWRQDTLDVQRTEAEYDEFDPDDPVVDTPGRTTLLTERRTRVQVRPSYVYRFSERVGAEFTALYQTVNLDSEGQTDSVDYDYLSADGSLLWRLSQTTQLGTGVYGSKYDGDNGYTANATGINLDIRHNWSPTFYGTAGINAERTEIDTTDPSGDGASNNWGLDVGIVRNGQISQLRLNAGRTFNPSSAGSRTEVDQVRVQYSRNLKERLSWRLAVRGYRSRNQGVASDDDRDYITADTSLAWNMTRTWYLSGGYSYLHRKYLVENRAGEDHVFKLGIGYRGLRPQ